MNVQQSPTATVQTNSDNGVRHSEPARRQVRIEYETVEIPHSVWGSVVKIEEWADGEGYDISLGEPGDVTSFQSLHLYNSQASALMAALALLGLSHPSVEISK